MEKAIGLLEIKSFAAAVEAADTMLKSSDIRLIHIERRLGGRLVSLVIDGDISSVESAIQAGKKAAEKIGKVAAFGIIPRPHPEILKFFKSRT